MRALPVVLLALVAAAYSSAAQAASGWTDMATVSATMGIQSGRLCIGDAPAGDIGCPTYAPSVTTAGDLIVSSTVSATSFVGDGSGLTNINAANVSGLSTDRITSGTTSMVANSATSIISITTAGVTTGYFTSAGLLVVPGISVTQSYGISSTTGYFSSNVGIGTSAPSTTLTISGTVWGSTYSGLIRTGLAAPTSQTASTVSALNDLSDVTISGASNGEVLSFNGGSWVNSSPASTAPAGNDTEIQFNNSGSFGASSALTWINGSSLLNATNIASSNVTTADASADRLLLNKASATCDASHDGTLRRNPTTGVLQICRH